MSKHLSLSVHRVMGWWGLGFLGHGANVSLVLLVVEIRLSWGY